MKTLEKSKKFLKKNPAKKGHRAVVELFQNVLQARPETRIVTMSHASFLKKLKRKRQFKKLDQEIVFAYGITQGFIVTFGRNAIIAQYDRNDFPLDLETASEIVPEAAPVNDTSHIEEPQAERKPQRGEPAGSIITGPGIILAFTETGFVFKDELGDLIEFNAPLSWSETDESWVFVHPQETAKRAKPPTAIKPSERRAQRKERLGFGKRKR